MESIVLMMGHVVMASVIARKDLKEICVLILTVSSFIKSSCKEYD